MRKIKAQRQQCINGIGIHGRQQVFSTIYLQPQQIPMSQKTEERKFQKTHGLFQYGKRKSVDFQWCLSTPTDVGHPNMAQCAHADMQSH